MPSNKNSSSRSRSEAAELGWRRRRFREKMTKKIKDKASRKVTTVVKAITKPRIKAKKTIAKALRNKKDRNYNTFDLFLNSLIKSKNVLRFKPIEGHSIGSKQILTFMIDALFQKHPHSGILTNIDEQTRVIKRIIIQITITANTSTVIDIKTPDNPYDFNIISNTSSYIMGDLHNPGVIDDIPIIDLGLKDTFLLQILQNLEGIDFCEYGTFKNICEKLQDKIHAVGNKNNKPFAVFPDEPSNRADSPNENPIIDGNIKLTYNVSHFITVFYGELLTIIKNRSILSVINDIQPFYILAHNMNFFSWDDDANLYMADTEKQTPDFLSDQNLLINLSADIISLMPQTQYFLLYHSKSRNISEFKLNISWGDFDEFKKDICLAILNPINKTYNYHKPFNTLEEFLEKVQENIILTIDLPDTIAKPQKAKLIKEHKGIDDGITYVEGYLPPDSGKKKRKGSNKRKGSKKRKGSNKQRR